jgi:hypothetical protein
MFKRLLVPVVALLTFVAVHAAESVLRDDHPDRYVVQRGDTLWDIAGRFLRKPWLWPEIWQANPQVANPHLIYPGDVLNLAYLGGRPQLTRDGPMVRESGDEAITTVPLSEVEPFLRRMRVLDGDAWRNLPYVVALEENRLRSTESNYIYARGLDVEPGQRVAIVRPTLAYRDVSEYNPRRREHEDFARGTPWAAHDSIHAPDEIRRPEQLLGYEVMEIGHARVIRGGDPVTLLVDQAEREIRAGDLIMPVDEAPFDLYFYPRAPDAVPEGMEVLASTDTMNTAGKYMVVALNRGARDGVENGQVYSVFKPGEAIHDSVRYPTDNVLRDLRRDDAYLTLPDDFAGHVMVFRVFDRISYGLIMESQRPVQIRDRLREPFDL